MHIISTYVVPYLDTFQLLTVFGQWNVRMFSCHICFVLFNVSFF